jgi:hypothetical protein
MNRSPPPGGESPAAPGVVSKQPLESGAK